MQANQKNKICIYKTGKNKSPVIYTGKKRLVKNTGKFTHKKKTMRRKGVYSRSFN